MMGELRLFSLKHRKKKKNEHSLRDRRSTSKRTNTRVHTEVPGEAREGGRETIWRGDSEEPPKFEERHESMCPRSSTNSQEGKLFEGKRMGISICAEKALDRIQH